MSTTSSAGGRPTNMSNLLAQSAADKSQRRLSFTTSSTVSFGLERGVVASSTSATAGAKRKHSTISSASSVIDVDTDDDDSVSSGKPAPSADNEGEAKQPKHSYSRETMRKILGILDTQFGGNQTKCAEWLATQTGAGWQHIDRTQLSKWQKIVNTERKKPGRKVNEDFENKVEEAVAPVKPAGLPYPEPPQGQCTCCDYHLGSARKATAPGWLKHWSTTKGHHVYFLAKDNSIKLQTRPTVK